jgi:hypothetical protein
MTVYTPTYKVTIAGTVQTSTTLEDATITYGRNDFFEATQPSYCNLELLNLDGTSPTVELLDTILIEVTDSTGAYVKLFTGEVSSVHNRFAGAGLGGKPNTLQIQAIGALGLLVKRYAGSVAYPEELDGARITRILEETLYTAWEDLSNTLTWNDIDQPYTTTTRTNLVLNPSFEVDTSGWESLGSPTVTRITTDSFTGVACARVLMNTIATSGVRIDNISTYRIPVVAGQTLSASTYMKNVSGSRNLRLSLRFYTTATTLTALSTHTGTELTNPTNWTRSSVTATAPVTALWADVSISAFSTGSSTDVYLFDSVLIELSNTVQTYFDGSYLPPNTLTEAFANNAWTGTANASTSTITEYDGNFTTWATYGVQGIDTIDAGRYEMLARSAQVEQAYNLTDITQQSGLGYLYDTTDFKIGYADAERRSENYAANLIELDANLVNADIQTRLQTADIVNSVVIQYDDPVLEVEAQNDTSINNYGLLQEVRSTILAETADATEQATNFVNYRGTPKVSLEEVTVNLANSDMTNAVRDNLLGVSMDTLLYLDNIPVGLIVEGSFEGFVEGWTWTLGRNNLELAMSVSNSIYSTLDVQWEDYNSSIQWQNLANDYRWLDVI